MRTQTPAAAYDAIPLGSASLVDSSVPVGYPSTSHGYLASIDGSANTYGYGEGASTATRAVVERDDQDQKGAVLVSEPGLEFTRETWWDALLVLYANESGDPFDITLDVPASVRESATQNITADLRSIFRASPHWLNFINLPRFFGVLLDPRTRHGIQPSLILGALALATFFKSHEAELGARGREKSLRLRDQAQSALEASLSSRWVDHSLVQAAWVRGRCAARRLPRINAAFLSVGRPATCIL